MTTTPTGSGGTDGPAIADSDHFVAVLHELKTQLGIVLTASELIARADLPPRESGYADMLRDAAETLRTLLDDLLDIGLLHSGTLKIESARLRPCRFIEKLIAAFRPRCQEKRIELVFRCEAPADTEILTDPVRLRQILTNLLDNAVKFTDHGTITVLVETIGQTPGETREGAKRHLRIIVADTGSGFDPADAERIFAPYVTTGQTTAGGPRGIGLGLAISRALAEQLGGTLSASGRIGVGATFTLTLPCEPPPPERPASCAPVPQEECEAATADHRADAPDLTGLRVLVADDKSVLRTLMSSILDQFGIAHEVVDSGEAALARLAGTDFDVVFLDLEMPGIGGIETALRIRRNGDLENLSLVALSAHSADILRKEVAALFDAYLEKPLQTARIYDLLCRLASAGSAPPTGARNERGNER